MRITTFLLAAGLLASFIVVAGSVYLVTGERAIARELLEEPMAASGLAPVRDPLPTRAYTAVPLSTPTATATPTDTPTALAPTYTPAGKMTAAPTATSTRPPPTATQPPPTAVPPSPTATATRAATMAALATATAVPAATSPPVVTPTSAPIMALNDGTMVNGIPLDQIVVMSPTTRQHVQDIFQTGQDLGRDARAFSRLGASTFTTYHFLGRWDDGPYKLGAFGHLQPAISYFSGSFRRIGQGAKIGLTSWAALDPAWAPDQHCEPAESPLACEIRLHNPAVLLIGLGTNDIGSAASFRNNLRQIVEETIAAGVVPILGTKADRYEGEDNRNNGIIREVAAEYQLPLWDFDLVAGTLPGRGVGSDEVHMAFYDTYDYTVPAGFQRGYGVFNLTALITLHAVYAEIAQVASDAGPAATLVVER